MSLTSEQCEEFWAIADVNGDGNVSIQELKKAIHMKAKLSDREIANMFCDIDKSGDGKISKDEFLDEMMKKPARGEALKQMFAEQDKNGDGSLSPDEIKSLICKSGQFKNADQVAQDVLNSCDKDGDGKISFDEFKKACC